jgi:hypothetical protein
MFRIESKTLKKKMFISSLMAKYAFREPFDMSKEEKYMPYYEVLRELGYLSPSDYVLMPEDKENHETVFEKLSDICRLSEIGQHYFVAHRYRDAKNIFVAREEEGIEEFVKSALGSMEKDAIIEMIGGEPGMPREVLEKVWNWRMTEKDGYYISESTSGY